MNETKHTPGPWRWEPNHCSSDERPCGSVTAPNSARPWMELAYLQGHPDSGFMADECLANARLIAAAPDLLAFAQDVADNLVLSESRVGEAARAVIAKATGAALNKESP